MNRPLIFVFIAFTALFLFGCSGQIDDSIRSQYEELSWIDLKPKAETESEQDPEFQSLEIVDDWYNDSYSSLTGVNRSYSGAAPQGYSLGVVSELNETNIRVPGFIVPVQFEPGNLVTEFFLVPYFGACIHKPPPPANQTIYVRSEKPIEVESIYDPVWIMGVVKTEQVSNDIALAAYTMDFHYIEEFVE